VVQQKVQGIGEIGFGVPHVEFIEVGLHPDEAEQSFKVAEFILIVL
jgi:hypothetical protein